MKLASVLFDLYRAPREAMFAWRSWSDGTRAEYLDWPVQLITGLIYLTPFLLTFSACIGLIGAVPIVLKMPQLAWFVWFVDSFHHWLWFFLASLLSFVVWPVLLYTIMGIRTAIAELLDS